MSVDIQNGAAFLIEEAGSREIFIPEHLSFEQKELARTVHDFVVNEILPKEELIEASQPGLMPKLLKEAAKLGILMAEIPAEFGGLGLGKVDGAAIDEGSTLQGSFNVSYMAHTGIGTVPLIYYGTKAQKEKYLPKLGSGEMIAAFALTEPEAGSDAMAITTKAVLSKDKKYYTLNGQKQFITNGGFANFFTIFAKTDEGITAFLVEKDFGGIKIGREEKKMGIHGSSTVPFSIEDVKVPVENVLGELGKGHHIAFNVLNVGRLRLGAACAGTSRHLINVTFNYDKERKQFGSSLISFQMIQEKLAMMVSRTYLLESMVFRMADQFDKIFEGVTEQKAIEAALREYAIEAAIAKVYGSESLFYVADDALQLHGGYGYCEDYGIERYFRDSRINRIYEGTNEVNRLVITGTLLRLAVKGRIDILTTIMEGPQKIKELLANAGTTEESTAFAFIEVVKRLALSVGGAAVQKFADKISHEQYILGGLADMLMEIYAIESAYVRAKQLGAEGKGARSASAYNALYYYITRYAAEILDKGRRMLLHVLPPDAKEIESYQKAMYGVLNIIRGDSQKMALKMIEDIDNAGGYPF